MIKGIENFDPKLKLYIRKRKARKVYKGNEYHYCYYELIQTFRDPLDKTKVVSKYIGFLGKKKNRKENLEKIKRRLLGNFDLNEISAEIEKAIK